MDREPRLQAFLDAALAAFLAHATSEEARAALAAIAAAAREVHPGRQGAGSRLPVCEWLTLALANASAAPLSPEARALLVAFVAVEPLVEWRRRPGPNVNAGPGFDEGHANAMFLGPGGIEARQDFWLGVSLLAPHVRYPDHDHAPEEVYLVLSGGEFSQDGGAWFTPGIGGSFWNRPGIMHAMRSGAAPLFAFWVLRA